jgi:3-hydroxyacyl-CoA dehydrogenase
MNYDERLRNVTVLGAAGKMGSGILLLTAIEMADLSLKPENKGKPYCLNAMDLSQEGLAGLLRYLRVQVTKIAEKKIVWLRKMYADRADLIENEQVLNQYVFDVLSVVRPVTKVEVAYESNLVFEAVSENKDLKIKIFNQIDQNNPNKPWYFTNTSSVPINLIDDGANLGGRVLGFHFYNPPAVQKLVELILPKSPDSGMEDFAKDYAKKLGKIIVPSNDYAGFIGNGHFMRDSLHAITEVERLSNEMSIVEAVYTINKVAQDYLVRPMGIFQLIDYVGIDVVQFIMNVMNPFLKDEDLHSDLLDKLIEIGVKGGQNSDGSQKDGFLKYEKGRPVAVINPETNKYEDISNYQEKCDEKLGKHPNPKISWKSTIRRKDKNQVFADFFASMRSMPDFGAQLAMNYGKRSNEIGHLLVSSGVANNEADVNTVMLTGFFHAYGPVNDYFVF